MHYEDEILRVYFLAFAYVSGTGCNKEGKDRSVSGLIIDTTNAPVSKMTFFLFVHDGASFNKPRSHEAYVFATDEYGHFNVGFNAKDDTYIGISPYESGSAPNSTAPFYIWAADIELTSKDMLAGTIVDSTK